MIFKTIIACIVFGFMTGCASISFNPDSGEIKYTRIGDQHIQGFSMRKTANGETKIKMEGQQSNAEALTEAIKLIGVLARPGK